MTCEQTGCDFDVFNSCRNHCSKNLCLKHVIEHGDIFLKNFTVAIDHLENVSHLLIDQINLATSQIAQRRQFELERINRFYDEKQFHLRQQNLFAENADRLIKEKSEQLINSQKDSICHLSQYDFEQLKIYARQIDEYSIEEEKSSPIPIEIKPKVTTEISSAVCPLTRPNVYGIRFEHDLRFDCEGGSHTRFTLLQHCEFYHRMLPACALRLRDAVFQGQPVDTPIFSANEILKNDEYFVDCPLTDPQNVFGALKVAKTLRHVPCARKRLTLPSLQTHFNTYHRMRRDAARKIYLAIKNKTMPDDEILFDADEPIGTFTLKD